jgi:AbiJ N-terminal domain 4
MTDLYFSERERGLPPRNQEQISEPSWGGLVAIVKSLLSSEAFGVEFPASCPDGMGCSGVDRETFRLTLQSEIPDLKWPLDATEIPPLLTVMDLLEFCHRYVGKSNRDDYHSYFGHYHYDYDREEGQKDFRQKVNRLFARHGLAYELQESGQVIRLVPSAFQESLQSVFQTGDPHLDEMLETARTKYLSPNLKSRCEALEKLWDAWERLKTVELASDKKNSVRILLDKASAEPTFRQLLEEEAKDLTAIGNNFMIRHTETNKIPVASSDHVDYLFQRMSAIIHLLLKARDSVKVT